jgi:alanyl aminopeptidase
LQARAFGNATSADFIAAIATASGKELAPAFASFLERAGEPELVVSTTCAGTAKVSLAQHRYVGPGANDDVVTPWQIPVCVAYGTGSKRGEQCTLLAQDSAVVELPKAAGCPQWVLVNSHGGGYFRTAYTVAQVTTLRDVAWPHLDETERRTLYFDIAAAPRYRPRGRNETIAMVPAMKQPLPLALSFVPRLLAGGDRFTIGDAVTLPLALDRFVEDDQRNKLEIWIRATYGAGATQLGVTAKPSDDLDVERERLDLFTLVAWFGRDPELVKQAVALGDHWSELPQAMRGAILAVAVDASPELFTRVLANVKTEPDRSKRDNMLVALGHVRDVERQRQALALLLDHAIDIRETATLLTAWSNESARAEVEAFYREHRAELETRMPKDEVTSGFGAIADAFVAACDAHRRDDIAHDLAALYAGRPGGERDEHLAIEWLDRCIASRTVLGPAVRSWLGGVKQRKPDAKPAKPGQK